MVLPPAAGNYRDLQAVKGQLLYRRLPRSGSRRHQEPHSSSSTSTEREEKTVLEDADGFEVTFDGKRMLVAQDDKFAILEIKSPQKFEKPIVTADMEATVDPRAEWAQMFEDVYRFQRDYFYDAGMHGVDWAAMKARYGKLLDDAVTRWDVDFIIGEFIGELNASHTVLRRRRQGDRAVAQRRHARDRLGARPGCRRAAGGVPREARSCAAVRGTRRVRSPLDEPGVQVKARGLHPRGQRRAARHHEGPVGRLPGPGQQDRAADRERQAGRRRGRGRCWRRR